MFSGLDDVRSTLQSVLASAPTQSKLVERRLIGYQLDELRKKYASPGE
jgi:hypothetical protein